MNSGEGNGNGNGNGNGLKIHCCSCFHHNNTNQKQNPSIRKLKRHSRKSTLSIKKLVFKSPSENQSVNDHGIESDGDEGRGRRRRRSSIKKAFDRDVLFLHLWNLLFMVCIVSTSMDLLFCYVLVVDEERNCIGFDKKSMKIAVVLRSIVDFVYLVLLIFRFCVGYFALNTANNGGARARARARARGDSARARRFPIYAFLAKDPLFCFTFDILAVLPLPQVVILLVIPKLRGSSFMVAVRSLKFVLLIQIFPRVFRICSFLGIVRWNCGILPDNAEVKALFNLFLYLFAGHVFGVYWYLFSVERKATCWQVNCGNHLHCPLNCNYSIGERFLGEASCSTKASNDSLAFNFGIFGDAFSSGAVHSVNFLWKMSYCYWWGLRNLSGLGQNLQTSNYIWEIYFSVTISVSGVVLFAILIGNLQTVMQGRFARLEEMRLERRVIKDWMSNKFLPHSLNRKIMQHQEDKWRETKGVDIENFLNNLPRDLKRKTRHHLCSGLIRKCLWFVTMDKTLLDAMCDRLKTVIYKKDMCIIREGDPVEDMHFILRGELKQTTTKSLGIGFMSYLLEVGDIFGEELANWALNVHSTSRLPNSSATVKTITEVEAFVLMADDLKFLASKFHQLTPQLRLRIRFYSPQWRNWAACKIQEAWRYHREKQLRRKEK